MSVGVEPSSASIIVTTCGRQTLPTRSRNAGRERAWVSIPSEEQWTVDFLPLAIEADQLGASDNVRLVERGSHCGALAGGASMDYAPPAIDSELPRNKPRQDRRCGSWVAASSFPADRKSVE